MRRTAWPSLLVLPIWVSATACGGDEGGSIPSNRARFALECDLNGVAAELTMNVEAVGVTGLTFGPGPNPDITGVIATGDVTYSTYGELVSPVARYVFTGENAFADFTDVTTPTSFERFRVQWVGTETGLLMVINPFGALPTQHACSLVSARYL